MDFSFVIVAVVLVVAMDFTNGFHDAANMVATVIVARAMSPMVAIIVVSIATFAGPILGGTAVASTIGSFVTIEHVDPRMGFHVITAAVLATISWNLITWRRGLPSSTSHALVAALAGAASAALGFGHVHWGFMDLANGQLTGFAKIVAALLISPLIGFLMAFLLHKLVSRLMTRARPSANRWIRRGQWLTAPALGFAHGTNDAQKSMGVLAALLVCTGHDSGGGIPLWVIVLCSTAITTGTLIGGWRIVKTLGYEIYHLRPLSALDSQVSSAAMIVTASMWGGPVSTTHVVSASIMGVGAAERPRSVRWSKVNEIAMNWVATLPASALLGAGFVRLLSWGLP